MKIVVLCCLVFSLANANDIRLGFADSRSTRIYNEIKEANPALWTRTDQIVISTAGNNVITEVLVTDLRPDKDGEASIVSGGIGGKTVTIGLSSPTILRGYRFEIEVFAADPNLNAGYYSKGGRSYDQYQDNGQFARKY